MTGSIQLERIENEASQANLGYYAVICLKKLRKAMKNLLRLSMFLR